MGKNIVILNRSPHKNANTSAFLKAFTEGTKNARTVCLMTDSYYSDKFHDKQGELCYNNTGINYKILYQHGKRSEKEIED